MKDPINILIVDDEKGLLRSLTAFFEDDGYEVLAAESGEQAIELLQNNKVDAGVIDIRLPGIDGREVIRQAHHLQPHMKFLIHTGSANFFLTPTLKKIGLAEEQVYMKPVQDMGILSAHIQRLVMGDA